MSQICCKRCYSLRTVRTTRKNFFQKVILLRLGLHPWKCLDCSLRFLSKDRGPGKRRKSSDQAQD
jgi:hypothetical protein